jgi:hypothetical protein
MNQSVNDAAIKAIYHLQYNKNRAIQFICSESNVTPNKALEAFESVVKVSR